MEHTYRDALLKLALNMGWTYYQTLAFWENEDETDEARDNMWQDLKKRGYLGDSDDVDSLAQFLYDEQILPVESLKVLDLTNYIPKTYLCIWGDGYICSEPRNAFVGEKTREELLADESFVDYHEQINNLFLGQSFNCIGTLDIMTVVRVK